MRPVTSMHAPVPHQCAPIIERLRADNTNVRPQTIVLVLVDDETLRIPVRLWADLAGERAHL